MTSNGDSTRQAGTLQLRRRLRQGLAAEVQYTWAKGLDDAALGGSGFLIAQNWLDLRAERGRSNFDQRQVATFQAQYTTGAGAGGFPTGRTGALFREWTVVTQVNFGTGLPLTPTSFSSVRRHRSHRQHPRQLHGRGSLRRARRTPPEPWGFCGARVRPVGQRGAQLHHRSRRSSA
jgi:hypothetical protein